MNKDQAFEREDAPGECLGILQVNIPVFGRLVSPETTQHLLAARREMLLAVRSLIDADIRRWERE